MDSTPRLSRGRSAAALVATLVAALALASALAGCGSDGTDDTATDPASSTAPEPPTSQTQTPTQTPTPESGSGTRATIPATGSAGVTQATMISATEGGGSESTLAFALDTDQARADFVAQFEAGFADTVATAAAELARRYPGATAYGATVFIGCEAPRGVVIDAGEAGFEVVPRLPRSTVQCLAAMTYVVLFAVPNA